MKKLFISLFFAVLATIGLYAQQISVVSPGGATSLYKTLQDAIEGAAPGSVIYLPGGGFPISDDVKIDKKLTIIGVSHRGDTENVDGATIIDGNLIFIGGSSGCSVMGVYITGDIIVGTAEDAVEDFTVKYCNANCIDVKNVQQSTGMFVNQSYLRGRSCFANNNVKLENNIMGSINYINGGVINHNVLIKSGNWLLLTYCKNTSITNNFILSLDGTEDYFSYVSNNCVGTGGWGGNEEFNPIMLDEGKTFDDIFRANKGMLLSSDYRLKEGVDRSKFMGTDGTVIGIEGGSGFNPDALAPVPYIVAKHVDEQTDASGKLTVKIRVKAGQ